MYHAVVVDDEFYVCSLICNLLKQTKLDIVIDQSFYDGEECFLYIKEKKPDIVITDIQIGDMSGLDMIERIRQEGLNTKFIIISGYNYFDYAKKAILYGVDNYLLKPIRRDELETAVEKVIQKLDEESGIQREVEKMVSQKKERDEQLFLQELWHENQDMEIKGEEDILERYGIAFPGRWFSFGIIHADWKGEEKKDTILLSRLYEIFREEMQHDGGCIASMTDERNIAFLLNIEENDETERNSWLKSYLRKISELYSEEDIHVCISISEAKEGRKGLIGSVAAAKLGIRRRFFYPRRRLLSESIMGKIDREEAAGEVKKQQEQIRKLAETERNEELKQYCQEIFVMNYNEKKEGVFIDSLTGTLAFVETNFPQINGSIRKPDLLRDNLFQIQELYKRYVDFLDAGIKTVTEKEGNSDTKVIASVRRYIQEHYAEHMELETIARQVYLTPAYLSTLFKEHTGEGIKDYIMKIRIEKAKELLSDIHYNVSEIADMVGYTDSKYFARVFKKYVGVKPTDYRKIRHKLH